MRFHVLSIPQTDTVKSDYVCGFTPAIVNFCKMMKSLGHYVILYGSEINDAPCDEHVVCVTTAQRKHHLGDTHKVFAPFESDFALWGMMNGKMIDEIARRKQPQDFICSIGGGTQRPVGGAHLDLMTVEYMVGYAGVFADYCVFCSHSWRQFVYGTKQMQEPRFYHETIPLYYDPEDYVVTAKKPAKPYLLYCGRMAPRKGLIIAQETADFSGLPLKMIGPGNPGPLPAHCEFLGEVSVDQRNQLMADAQAVMVPTMYNEPFASTCIEAQLCGTPVITTNWGSFPELVQQGVNGYRANTLRDFVNAAHKAKDLDGVAIRARALEKYSIHTIKHQYQEYFSRLLTLWGEGWYTDFRSKAP